MDSGARTQGRATKKARQEQLQGLVFDIQRYCINDGPGIRTTVFLKGCPLRCLWCSNPESQRFRPELLYQLSLCTRCYRCVQACPHGATSVDSDGSVRIDRKLCQACGQCLQTCYAEARKISGRYMTVDEVMEVVIKDMVFYRTSGGGVTLSGGEPAFQADFALALLQACHGQGIHTAIETCGYAEKSAFFSLARHADLVLFDLKHRDAEAHRRLTGGDNSPILDNLQWLAQEKKAVIVRLPLVPSATDSEENLRAMGRFLAGVGLQQVELVPYHEFGLGKYEALGWTYSMEHLRPPSPQEVERAREILGEFSLEVGLA